MHKCTVTCAIIVLCGCAYLLSEEDRYRYSKERDFPILLSHLDTLLKTLMKCDTRRITRSGAISVASENAYEYWTVLSNPSTPSENLITGAIILDRKVRSIGPDDIDAALDAIKDRLPTFNEAVHATIKEVALDAHIHYLDNNGRTGESLWKTIGVFRIRVIITIRNKEALVLLEMRLRDIAGQGLIDLLKDLSSAYERRKKGENQKTFFDELSAVYLSGEQLKSEGK